jgi:hypothetical protein
MDLSSIEQIIRTQIPNAQDSEVKLYLDSVKRDMGFGADYSDMSEDDIVEDFEFYLQSKMDESKKPSTKMKKSELKEMIKAAFLSEADFTSGQDDDAAPAIASMYDPLYEAEEESLDDILVRIAGTKADPYMAEEIGANWDSTKPKDVGRKYVTAIKDAHLNLGIVSDIVQAGQFMDREFSDEINNMQMYLNMLLQSTSGGNEPMMDNIKTQNMTAKEKDTMLKTPFTETLYEAEEEEIEVDAEEKIEKPANDSIVVDKRIVSLSSLPSDTRKILDSLETLRAQAEEFGDQKFITQVGNTIIFFTRDFVVAGDEPTKAKVDESLEMLRMRKIAGLLTEGEYAKAILREAGGEMQFLPSDPIPGTAELTPDIFDSIKDKLMASGKKLLNKIPKNELEIMKSAAEDIIGPDFGLEDITMNNAKKVGKLLTSRLTEENLGDKIGGILGMLGFGALTGAYIFGSTIAIAGLIAMVVGYIIGNTFGDPNDISIDRGI